MLKSLFVAFSLFGSTSSNHSYSHTSVHSTPKERQYHQTSLSTKDETPASPLQSCGTPRGAAINTYRARRGSSSTGRKNNFQNNVAPYPFWATVVAHTSKGRMLLKADRTNNWSSASQAQAPSTQSKNGIEYYLKNLTPPQASFRD